MIKNRKDSLAATRAEGCEVAELSREGHDAFAKVVQPLYDDARKAYGPELFKLLPPA